MLNLRYRRLYDHKQFCLYVFFVIIMRVLGGCSKLSKPFSWKRTSEMSPGKPLKPKEENDNFPLLSKNFPQSIFEKGKNLSRKGKTFTNISLIRKKWWKPPKRKKKFSRLKKCAQKFGNWFDLRWVNFL